MHDDARRSGRDVLRGVVAGERRRVAAGCVLGASHQIGEALIPVLIGVIVDRAIVHPDVASFARWALVLAVVYVFLSGGFQLGSRAGEYAKEYAAHGLRMRLMRRVLDPRGGASTGRPPGALVSVATEDARRAGSVAFVLPLGFSAAVGLAAGAVLLLRASVPLGLLILLGTPVLMGLGQLLARPLEHRSHAEQERAAHASGVAADLVAGVRVLQGLGAQRAASDRYRRTSRASLDATVRAARAEAVQTGLMQALTGVFIALVALVGGRLVLSGSIGLGELVAAVGLALFIPGPLQVMSWMAAEVARSRASAGRVAEVLGTPGDIAGADGSVSAGADHTGSADDAPRGSLRLSGLVHEGLDGVDLTVAPGEFVGVVVTEPAHADALVRCLARRVDPDAGRLELDGVPFTDLAPRSLRSRVLVAEHGAELFAGSLRDNITAIGDSTHPAAAAAGADEVAASLPGGLDAPVGERGRSLSGGQRQRVALARALAADRDVLVVHDPTTAIDAATESRIATGIRELRRGRTTVLVTSSPALLAVADRVALIDGGRLADEAPHEELVRRSSLYRTAVLA
ncbi:ABC transporter ATP-binding protein [Streptomyces formicae]|uniref:Bifunctional ABC transporter n=1 Tax=Streptomyces formicae TaxID=1616117 RepID=A0A291QN95_9ACTN|nr:ABC transporter ATP-binding protein [Streptomyces formicae]ATL32974.1 bifunctional ABC transporter [Streptomyces formicae]